MTLKEIINNEPSLLEFIQNGNHTEIANRLSSILPKRLVETRLSRLGILSLYANPSDGLTVLATIDTVAQSNPIVAEIKAFMGPGVDPSCLPDWSLPSIRAALILPVELGGLGLTQELANPILAASEKPAIIDVNDVSEALRSE